MAADDKGRLFYNGDVYTMDASRPRAEAVAVAGGNIVAVGSKDECAAALQGEYVETDLGGAALLPGFIDTHMHPVMTVFFDMNVNLHGVRDMAELQERMRGAGEGKPAGEWAVGLNFDENDMDDPRLPSRHDLDAACPDRPAVILKHDGHMTIGNTLAIKAAGVNPDTPDPDGGVIDREADGTAAGPFRENATPILLSAMPMPDIDLLMQTAAETFKRFASKGITSAGAMLQTDEEGPAGKSGVLDLMAMQMLLGVVPLNLCCYLFSKDVKKILDARNTQLHTDSPGGHRIAGIKIYADGTYGSCTAFMYEPFSDQPDKQGFMVLSDEELYRRISDAHNAGLQIAIHSIGDAANRRCVDLYEKLLTEFPRDDHRHRLEHASQLDEKTLDDIKRLGIVISTQPLFIHSEKGWLHKRLGKERTPWTYPFKKILDAGVPMAGASDSPIESIDVLHAIECCVTREGFETQECISAHDAIGMYTTAAAYAQFEEDVKGSIVPGKRADLVVLENNPVDVAPEQIAAIKVLETIVGGKTVYSA